MTKKVIAPQALQRIERIHHLSKTYNQKVSCEHTRRLLELMRHHVEEIGELCRDQDTHALVETGDLMVLCCELLLEQKADIDQVMRQCFERYERKLTQLIKEADSPAS